MTLSEILESARRNKPLDVEDCRYALCAMANLMSMAQSDVRKIWKGNPTLQNFLVEENFQRYKRTLAVDPKTWLGENYDPKNPDYQKRLDQAEKLAAKLFEDLK